jgi:hypothetical protein
MLAINITTALGSSIMAFVLGMLIGIALGYIIWADRKDQKATKKRVTALEDDSVLNIESTRVQDATNLKDRDATHGRLDSLEGDALKKKQRGHDESK